jgi:hypothetical protein
MIGGMTRRSASGRRRRRWLLSGGAALLILVVAALIALIIVAGDEEALRGNLEDTASGVLGMEVRIVGPVRRGLWPAPHVAAGQLQIGAADAPIAEIESLEARLAITQLFRGRLRARSMNFAGAEIRIARDASGQFSFQRAARAPLRAGRLPRVRFSQLALDYVDEAAGTRVRAAGCQGRFAELAVVRPGGADAPARIELDGEVRCESVRWQDVDIADVAIEARARGARLELEAPGLSVFDGEGRGRIDVDFSVEPPRSTLEFVLDEFELETFLQSLEPGAKAEGRMNLSVELTATGESRQAIERSLGGKISLRGEALTLHGVDIDRRLSDYESTRSFGLADIGAVLFVGPIGLVVTKGHDFARLLRAGEGTTEVVVLVSDWALREGKAHADDVAAATRKNRIAVHGRLDYAARSFDGLKIALLDKDGCAVLEQAVSGSFSDPQVEEPGAIETLLGPLIDLVQKGLGQLAGEECEVIYDGAVRAP